MALDSRETKNTATPKTPAVSGIVSRDFTQNSGQDSGSSGARNLGPNAAKTVAVVGGAADGGGAGAAGRGGAGVRAHRDAGAGGADVDCDEPDARAAGTRGGRKY